MYRRYRDRYREYRRRPRRNSDNRRRPLMMRPGTQITILLVAALVIYIILQSGGK